MIILILFAFLAGVVTILSPCILPILPIILAGSVTTGKRKPLGIVAGFVGSFTFFTLFLSTIVQFFGISADLIRSVSIVIVFVFGLSLIAPQFQILLEKIFAKISTALPTNTSPNQGFFGGIGIGLSLGLLWTPCVGPILASVITLALTGTVTTTAFFLTLAYSLGTALPMLVIIYTGRTLFQKIPWLLSQTQHLQQFFGVVMVALAVMLFFGIDRNFQTWVLQTFPNYGTGLTTFEQTAVVSDQLDQLRGDNSNSTKDMEGKPTFVLTESLSAPFAPELVLGGQWFNSTPLTLKELKGKVVIVDFWTYSCINCIRTLPYLKSWHEKYSDKGLVIIGVHAPEFEFEKSVKNVERAIRDFDIQYPVMQDNNFATWRAYSNQFWPAKYIVDKEGKIRYTHFGEGKYEETEQVIQQLLSETGANVEGTAFTDARYQVTTRTPETYLGTSRLESLASPQSFQVGEIVQFSYPATLYQNQFALQGNWAMFPEYAMTSEKDAKLAMRFESKNVFLVLSPSAEGSTSTVRILLDGQPISSADAGKDVVNSMMTIDSDRLYDIVHLDSPGKHILEIQLLDGSIQAFAFTFG